MVRIQEWGLKEGERGSIKWQGNCGKNEENPEGSKSSARESVGRNEEVCKQKMKEERKIQSRGLSTAKYERLEMANEREKIREIDRAFCGPLQSQGNRL